ncbi:OLC1v1004070C1 [Oldenlandia corymbosa var. corymbosa]|uniref:OLC1v1004070C1 n=1 Tax=Oldenlandia corymbosa var. corymbosa TaxID=529605 RepID=A0AAV1DBF6_OLDCO|nr:OLC1v1004070C1 [Oldenlandia corymbosa var. corymbosa]
MKLNFRGLFPNSCPGSFTPEELCNVITLEDDPLVCLELFNWATKQHRFRHNVSSFHITIKKLGAAKMYEEMDNVVDQVLAIRSLGTEALYNAMIYYFTEARKLTRAVNIYKHMMGKLDCRPSITTYNILFTALLSRGKEFVHQLHGYVLLLHVNDALRLFHQLGVVYSCLPDSFSYNYLIHGLCAQGRTNNAMELCVEMKEKGFIPSVKSYNSTVNSLALGGELDQAVNYLWEMIENQRSVDFITYRTLFDEICRQNRGEDAKDLLEKLQEKRLLGEGTYRDLLHGIEGNFRSSWFGARFRIFKFWLLRERSKMEEHTDSSRPRAAKEAGMQKPVVKIWQCLQELRASCACPKDLIFKAMKQVALHKNL